jgi:hypothetical protein
LAVGGTETIVQTSWRSEMTTLLNFKWFLISLLCCSSGLILASDLIFHVILGEVNGKLPPEQRYSVFFVNLKLPEIMRKHAQFYPESLKRLQVNVLFAFGAMVGVVALVIGVIHYS